MLLNSLSILLLFTPSTQASSSLPSIIFLLILLLVLCVPYPSLPSTPFSISPTFNFLHGRPVSRNSIKMTTSEAASEADSAMSQVNTFFHIRFKSFFGKNRECIPILFFIQLKGHKNCIGQQVNTLRTSFKKGFP